MDYTGSGVLTTAIVEEKLWSPGAQKIKKRSKLKNFTRLQMASLSNIKRLYDVY